VSEKVRYEVEAGVATITIARPDVRNAMDRDVFAALYELGTRAGDDEGVRAVVVTGEGNFSSGIDTSVFTSGNGSDPVGTDVATLQRSFTIFETISKPVVAALDGPSFGAGFQLALACDLRVAAEGVRLSVMEVRWGIIPDLGATTRLPRLVGIGRAKELAFTAREIGAEEALAWGLVNRVTPAGEHLKAATEWARELAAGPPLAIAGIKRLMNASFDAPIATGLEREAMVQRRILASQDFIEAVGARIERRTPQFKAR